MHDMTGMGLMMLLALLFAALLIGVVVFVAVRAAHARRPTPPTGMETLKQRLASGEITPEDYYERESVLRESQPARRSSR